MSPKQAPLLLVISAPSGAGKSSLCNRLTEHFPQMVYSVSCTKRAPRGGERDGIHYHFLVEAEFDRRVQRGDFLEHARVHGHRYGTLKQTTAEALARGSDVIMDIDVQGAQQIRRACVAMNDRDLIKQSFVDIFIAPPSMEELRRRLCSRATDRDDVIELRLRNAAEEMRHQASYQHVVVNDDFEKAVTELIDIVTREHHKRW
jgi:guanylate kinase